MGKSLSDKVIAAHALEVHEDLRYSLVSVDAVLGHDATIALLIDDFRRRRLRVWDATKVLFVNDHFSPAASIERANISRMFIDFARELGVELHVDRGICHQILVEHRLCAPGALIIGADSHTIMGGGLGACCTGMGTTDILYALVTGTTWLRRPQTIKVELRGRLPEACSGRDVILSLLAQLGEDGARYASVELHDLCDPPLTQDDRFAIANMTVEAGAKFGVFVPDAVTVAYCTARDGRPPEALVRPDPDAAYAQTLSLDLTKLAPLVAKPWSPANVVPLDEVAGTRITHAFLGSCSSGRLEDIRVASEVVKGRQIHRDVRFIVIPASMAIFKAALRLGYVETLTDAGAVFNQTSCGPCGGIDKGILGGADVCVSTSNRNFRGRMGDPDSQTFLASARTVAQAALAGRLEAYSMSEPIEPRDDSGGEGPRSWVFGDNVNTDVLHPPHFYSLDPERVKRGLFKGVDETLQARLRPGDLVIGGRNFGCGSSRETSIRSFLLNGIGAVIAVDFARIFFRNATNHGLPCLTLARAEDKVRFEHGGPVHLDLAAWSVELGRAPRVLLEPVSPFVQEIWRKGGLLALMETGRDPRV